MSKAEVLSRGIWNQILNQPVGLLGVFAPWVVRSQIEALARSWPVGDAFEC